MGISRKQYYNIFTLLTVSSISCTVPPVINPGILKQTKSIGECQSCKLFIDSFQKGLERTSTGKFEGGDAAWEEEKLQSYKWSEVRLIDIQESICIEEPTYSVQCHHMAERAEEMLEEWWFKKTDDSENLFNYICIQSMQVCCPRHHYGKNCNRCPGDQDNVCSGNGVCRGDGTRKGNGTCLCHKGYSGELCDECDVGYYLSYKDQNKMLCSKCHISCLGGCNQGSKKDCVACKEGFTLDADEGCLDINECENTTICSKDQFCLNSIGSYKCANCDISCDGCYGDNLDMCKKCANGYVKEGEICIPQRGQDVEGDTLTTSRYRVYIALLLSTIILLPKSTFMGTVLGVIVVTYIVGSEYYCMLNGHKGLIDMKNYDLYQLFKI